MEPLIRAASLRGFLPLVEELGGDPGELLRRFGISRQIVDSDDGLVSITAHDRMLDAAAAELRCPDLGLRLAERQDLDILGPIAVAIQSSSTATDAFECAARFLFVHSPVLTIGVDADPWHRRGVVALTYRKDVTESPYSPQAIELGLGLFYRVAAGLLGRTTGLRSTEIPHGPVSAVRRYVDFFGVDVKFQRPVAALCVERRILDDTFATADADIRAAAVDYLTGAYSDPTRSAVSQVRRAAGESLPTRPQTIGSIAEMLTVHPRTLQRRLAAEGTSFGAVVDDLRRVRAHSYITGTDLSFTQIAHLVGFTEQSSLSHATRRWYGQSPRELRRRAKLS